MHCNTSRKQAARGLNNNESQRGVSLVEILITVSIIAIVSAFAMVQFTRTNEAFDADNSAYKVLNYFREASSRAVSNHHSYRVVINTNTNNITMINENTNDQSAGGNGEGDSIGGDDTLVKQEPVGVRVSFSQPSGISLPASPYNYAAAPFTTPSGEFTIHFNSDGSASDPWGSSPVSYTVFVWPTDLPTQLGLVRAVTIFGSSSSAKFWMYSANAGALIQS